MNTTGKVIVGIIVVIVIVAGGYYWYSSTHNSATTNGTSMTASSTTTGTITESGTAVTPLPAGSNNSDAALTQDTAALDAQINTFNTDKSEASQSTN